jgi:hypothetical protein
MRKIRRRHIFCSRIGGRACDYYKASGGSLVFVPTKGLAHFDSLNHDSFYDRNNSLMAECNKMDRAESWERFVPEDEFLILERFRSA